MDIKTIVKVMNFHALLRVDHARRAADQYAMLEREVIRMIDLIQNNRNFILDKRILNAPKDAPRLRIYIGSDMGFCGAVNASINSLLNEETGTNTVVAVGRKIHGQDHVKLYISQDEFSQRYDEISAIISDGVHRRRFSGVDLCYNHYYNMSRIEPIVKTIFPVKLGKGEPGNYADDFSVEGNDINAIMEALVVTYLNYEVKIAAVNSFASENILRQGATNDSLEKIEDMEQAALWVKRKKLNQKAAKKVIDTYIISKRKSH